MRFGSLLQRIQNGLSAVELVHTSHPRWPLPPTAASASPIYNTHTHTSPQSTTRSSTSSLRISVLDSSFNPPTLAHLALAHTPPPASHSRSPPATPAPIKSEAEAEDSDDDFDARLLLLSVRNADKQLAPGDATHAQRAEMMVLLASALASPSPPHSHSHNANVAVAIIDEPTFARKSAVLLAFLRARLAALSASASASTSASPEPKLTFLMGTDTLVRLFAPRYYADERAMAAALTRLLSPDGDDARIVCARRVARRKSTDAFAAEEAEVEADDALPEFVAEIPPAGGRIAFVDIGEEERTYSSSEVRAMLARRKEAWKAMVPPNIAEYIVQHNLYSLLSA